MVWDLRAALLAKEEFETARLIDFEFRERARTFRLMGEELGIPASILTEMVALHNDEAILERLQAEHGLAQEQLGILYTRCRAEARRQLIGERGDPTPHRLG